ncbi:hypothetical protein [Hymenobacter aerophilus]|uniref:hypothetical protein n=1 Tax=Hymenobacter aerophilus TaxID=119644 RepID=UPI0003602F50|nr:hypothetical protein [Hymenobacter aerophilus]
MPDFLRPDAALLALRPVVTAETTTTPATPGDFLHATLRPVLKLQNPLLLAVVADFVRDHHVPLATAAPADQVRLLAELLGRNTKLRYTVVGLITGVFSTEETAFYRQHRPELNRRLLELATRRVQDQAATVAALSLTT